MKKVLIPLAEGCEELEAVTLIDLLRRAEIVVTTAALDKQLVSCSRGTKIKADALLDDVLHEDFDLIVLPGGLPGADNLNADSRIHTLISDFYNANKWVSAICAAPRVLVSNPSIQQKKITAFPGSLNQIDCTGFDVTDSVVEVDGYVVTSKGPGTAMELALTLIELLSGKEKRQEVEAPLQRS